MCLVRGHQFNPQCAHFVELSDEMDSEELDTVCTVFALLQKQLTD